MNSQNGVITYNKSYVNQVLKKDLDELSAAGNEFAKYIIPAKGLGQTTHYTP